MKCCAVKDCLNKQKANSECSFFRFPKNENLSMKWLQFCKNEKTFRDKTWTICSDHFKDEDFEINLKYKLGFSTKRLLKDGVIPSIIKSVAPTACKRIEKLQKRSDKKLVASLISNADNPESQNVNNLKIKDNKNEEALESNLEHIQPVALANENINSDQSTHVFQTQMDILQKEVKQLKKVNHYLYKCLRQQQSELKVFKRGMLKLKQKIKVMENKK
ncbi:52 kDa repressor of the inhibitor of the protein kinase-like [Teleopsis dalmanni]|uniref:52 kDa repressor of the inhibitor of the protein kinase-like n=1 Tax=Teleopsis dalmanni TaxID=139649 RepID=UPI0018CD8992|nr:52 kDa repressor of the inhibitor of the protein kinase-like [Teleopsis dalmanni]